MAGLLWVLVPIVLLCVGALILRVRMGRAQLEPSGTVVADLVPTIDELEASAPPVIIEEEEVAEEALDYETRVSDFVPSVRELLSEKAQKDLNDVIDTFPPLSGNTVKILAELRKEVPCSRRLTDLVSQDPTLTAGLLRISNSAASAQIRAVTSVDQAILLLGNDVVLSIAMRGAMAGLKGQRRSAKLLNHDDLLLHNIATGLFAGQLARNFLSLDPQAAITAGLLHDIGKLLMSVAEPEFFDMVLGIEHTEIGESRLAKEERIFGYNHSVCGSLLVEKWGLPEVLVHAIELHHHPLASDLKNFKDEVRDIAAVIFLANQLAKLSGCSGDDKEVGIPNKDFAKAFNLPKNYEILHADFYPKVRDTLEAFKASM